MSSPPCLPPPCCVLRPRGLCSHLWSGDTRVKIRFKQASTENNRTSSTVTDPGAVLCLSVGSAGSRGKGSRLRFPTVADEGGGVSLVKVCFLLCSWHFAQLILCYLPTLSLSPLASFLLCEDRPSLHAGAEELPGRLEN